MGLKEILFLVGESRFVHINICHSGIIQNGYPRLKSQGKVLNGLDPQLLFPVRAAEALDGSR